MRARRMHRLGEQVGPPRAAIRARPRGLLALRLLPLRAHVVQGYLL